MQINLNQDVLNMYVVEYTLSSLNIQLFWILRDSDVHDCDQIVFGTMLYKLSKLALLAFMQKILELD